MSAADEADFRVLLVAGLAAASALVSFFSEAEVLLGWPLLAAGFFGSSFSGSSSFASSALSGPASSSFSSFAGFLLRGALLVFLAEGFSSSSSSSLS